MENVDHLGWMMRVVNIEWQQRQRRWWVLFHSLETWGGEHPGHVKAPSGAGQFAGYGCRGGCAIRQCHR